MGFGLVIGFIAHLYTTRYYISQITIGRNRPSRPTVSSLVVAWWRIRKLSFASVLMFLPADSCLTTWLIAPTVDSQSQSQRYFIRLPRLPPPAYTSRHGPHRKHRSCVAVSNCCRENLIVCEAVTQWRLLYSCPFCGRCLATGLHATIYSQPIPLH
jgi:hypothetical protein